jgi:hypothetical protein
LAVQRRKFPVACDGSRASASRAVTQLSPKRHRADPTGVILLVPYAGPGALPDYQKTERIMDASLLAEHHEKAAEHHDVAAEHHRQAAEHHRSAAHEKAAHHAHLAHGHHLHATHHAEEAGKHHAEAHGDC